MALLLHTRMIPIFAPTLEDLRVRDQCGEHAMVLCGSRDGYWLFQDSYGLSRGEIGVIKVRKGRCTVVRFVEMKFPRVVEDKSAPLSRKRKSKNMWIPRSVQQIQIS
ncbi:hypothetical protein F2Q69_00033040 [Brassica cretica]|uniref:Uncharacterized protein n=1 Tax=Brassica cretica TaxID=69181 RepID=A0A8S9SIC4_BRACR|nr:hypothetical protein F2Q69_00033040 [Brassica cretica]